MSLYSDKGDIDTGMELQGMQTNISSTEPFLVYTLAVIMAGVFLKELQNPVVWPSIQNTSVVKIGQIKTIIARPKTLFSRFRLFKKS